jgi:hypothetical protein
LKVPKLKPLGLAKIAKATAKKAKSAAVDIVAEAAPEPTKLKSTKSKKGKKDKKVCCLALLTARVLCCDFVDVFGKQQPGCAMWWCNVPARICALRAF